MRRATLFLLALSLVLATLATSGAAYAAAPARGSSPTVQNAPADAGIGGGLLSRILEWLVDFAAGPTGDGEETLAPSPNEPSGTGGHRATLDPDGHA